MHKLLQLWNALGISAYSQEHFTTIIYIKSWGGGKQCELWQLRKRELPGARLFCVSSIIGGCLKFLVKKEEVYSQYYSELNQLKCHLLFVANLNLCNTAFNYLLFKGDSWSTPAYDLIACSWAQLFVCFIVAIWSRSNEGVFQIVSTYL